MNQPQKKYQEETSDHPIIRSSDHLDNVTSAMNNMYRYTRHVYDASRKFYLLGRDRLIRELALNPGEVVVEVGCGTARNLIKMAQIYPQAHFYGLDASEEMLKTAAENIKRAGLSHRIMIAHGFAQNFDPHALFGLDPARIDRIVFSYALSMIPPWQESVDHALNILRTDILPLKEGGPRLEAGGGDDLSHQQRSITPSGLLERATSPFQGEDKPQYRSIHIVDFGSQAGLPKWFRAFLFWWLDLFGVHFRPELPVYIASLAQKGLKPEITSGLKGYYWVGKITL